MSAEWYATQKGWSLLKANLMVEGTLDVAYFMHADQLYAKKYKKKLTGVDLSIFASGLGGNGGTFGILDQFPTLYNITELDVDGNNRRKYILKTLFDSDYQGRKDAARLLKVKRSLKFCRDIFLLSRSMPRRSRDHEVLKKHIDSENAEFNSLDCEIEDLLDEGLIDFFLSEHPNYKAEKIKSGRGFHVEMQREAKPELYKFSKKYGSISDFERLIDTLKSIRFYFGLPLDGCRTD